MNIEETINTIKFSEITQKGYKIMSNDEFDRIVNGVLQLQTENQQLKSTLEEIRTILNELYEFGKEWHWDNGALEEYVIDLLQIIAKPKESDVK